MDINDSIILTELEFPKIFAHYKNMKYGKLFYNETNKCSHDSNHAIIYADKIDDLDRILEEIKEFYIQKGITPRIYHPYRNGFLEHNRESFIKHGYIIEVYDNCSYMLLTGENKINVPKRLAIKRLREWDDRIASQIFIPNDKEYTIDVIKDSIDNEQYHLFVGFLDEVAVTVASLSYSDYNCVRLDDVETAINYRNHGYSRELISHIIRFHKEQSDAVFYLWVENPTAQKIYIEGGFTLMPNQYEAWSASYNLAKDE